MKNIDYDNVSIITVAKVASANFLYCNYNKTKKITHGHDLSQLKNILDKKQDHLIITGIRNPIERNLSYLFQTYNQNYFNNVKTKKNNYKGENCYIPEIASKRLEDVKPEEMIDLYFKQKYHNTFNEWFEEFLNITNINKFDKNQGLDFYKFPNNNTLMIYTVESLNDNIKYICDILGITNFKNQNDASKRSYANLYQKINNSIRYKEEYLNSLLFTKIMNFFYKKSDIESFYSKYKLS